MKTRWEKNKKMNKKYVIASVIFSTILMCFVDGVIVPPYFYKSIIKIVLFLLVPMIYFLLYKEKNIYLKKLFVPKKKDFLLALLLGAGVFAVIMTAYFLCRNYIDFSGIQESLTGGIGVNADNFVYVAMYISVVNSFLEEFFFRGFAFLTLKKFASKRFAYLFSSLMFAFYHVAMMIGWYDCIVIGLCLIGLMIGGCIFNYFDEQGNSIYLYWLIHMFANLATNTIGFMLFYL